MIPNVASAVSVKQRPDKLMAGNAIGRAMSRIKLRDSYFDTRCFQGRRACFSNKNAMFGCTSDNVFLYCCERDEESVVLVDGAIGSTSTHSWQIKQKGI